MKPETKAFLELMQKKVLVADLERRRETASSPRVGAGLGFMSHLVGCPVCSNTPEGPTDVDTLCEEGRELYKTTTALYYQELSAGGPS